jgi:hypothetical protein
MPGTNVCVTRALRGTLNENVPRPKRPTVFISHRSTDKAFARELAAEIVLWGIDVWLDDDDEATKTAEANGDNKALALAIEAGVKGSTHMLALLSPKTAGSMWVPYEVGAGRACGLRLGFVVELGTKDLPAWLALGETFKSQFSLRFWLIEVVGPLARQDRLWPRGPLSSPELSPFLP